MASRSQDIQPGDRHQPDSDRKQFARQERIESKRQKRYKQPREQRSPISVDGAMPVAPKIAAGNGDVGKSIGINRMKESGQQGQRYQQVNQGHANHADSTALHVRLIPAYRSPFKKHVGQRNFDKMNKIHKII